MRLQAEQREPRRLVAQQELALMISISRQTTNEIRKGMEAQGILRV